MHADGGDLLDNNYIIKQNAGFMAAPHQKSNENNDLNLNENKIKQMDTRTNKKLSRRNRNSASFAVRSLKSRPVASMAVVDMNHCQDIYPTEIRLSQVFEGVNM